MNSHNLNFDHTYCFQLDQTLSDIERLHKELLKKQQEIDELKAKVGQLQQKVHEWKQRRFCIEKFEKDDQAVQFYTGFANYSALIAYYDYLKPKIPKLQYWRGSTTTTTPAYQTTQVCKPGPKRKLSSLQEFFMVFVRLKLGLFVFDVCDRFEISTGHFSKVFTTWINFLFFDLKEKFAPPKTLIILKVHYITDISVKSYLCSIKSR